MEERIRSTRSSLAVFVGCCAMSFIGFALITNTSGLYFDAISRDLHVGRAKVSLTVSIRLICSAISMAAFSRFSHRIRLRPTLIGCIGICAYLRRGIPALQSGVCPLAVLSRIRCDGTRLCYSDNADATHSACGMVSHSFRHGPWHNRLFVRIGRSHIQSSDFARHRVIWMAIGISTDRCDADGAATPLLLPA